MSIYSSSVQRGFRPGDSAIMDRNSYTPSGAGGQLRHKLSQQLETIVKKTQNNLDMKKGVYGKNPDEKPMMLNQISSQSLFQNMGLSQTPNYRNNSMAEKNDIPQSHRFANNMDASQLGQSEMYEPSFIHQQSVSNIFGGQNEINLNSMNRPRTSSQYDLARKLAPSNSTSQQRFVQHNNLVDPQKSLSPSRNMLNQGSLTRPKTGSGIDQLRDTSIDEMGSQHPLGSGAGLGNVNSVINGKYKMDFQLQQELYARLNEDTNEAQLNLEQRQRIFEDIIIQRIKVIQNYVKKNVQKMRDSSDNKSGQIVSNPVILNSIHNDPMSLDLKIGDIVKSKMEGFELKQKSKDQQFYQVQIDLNHLDKKLQEHVNALTETTMDEFKSQSDQLASLTMRLGEHEMGIASLADQLTQQVTPIVSAQVTEILSQNIMPQVEFKIVEKTQEFYDSRRIDERIEELKDSINEQTKLLQKSLSDINGTLETKIEKNFKDIEETRRNLEKLKEQDGNELKRLSMLLTDIESGVAQKSQQIEQIQTKNLHLGSSIEDIVNETRVIHDKLDKVPKNSDLELIKKDITPKQDIENMKQSIDGVKFLCSEVQEDIGKTKELVDEQQKKQMELIESKLKNEILEKFKFENMLKQQQPPEQVAVKEPKSAAPVSEAPPVTDKEEKKPKKKKMMVEETFQQDEIIDLGKQDDQVEEVAQFTTKVNRAQAVSSAPPKKQEVKEVKKQAEEPTKVEKLEVSSIPVAPIETENLSVKNIDKAPSLNQIDTPQSVSVKDVKQVQQPVEETPTFVDKVQPQPASRYQEEKEDSVIDQLDIELNMIGGESSAPKASPPKPPAEDPNSPQRAKVYDPAEESSWGNERESSIKDDDGFGGLELEDHEPDFKVRDSKKPAKDDLRQGFDGGIQNALKKEEPPKQPEKKKVVIEKKPLFDDNSWNAPLQPGQSQADKVRGILEGAVNAQVLNVLNDFFEDHENKLNEANDYLYAGVKEINNDLKKKPQDLDDMNMLQDFDDEPKSYRESQMPKTIQTQPPIKKKQTVFDDFDDLADL